MPSVHGRLTRVLVEGIDLSCFLRDASVSRQLETVDGTPFCAGVKDYVEGFPDARASVSGYYDATPTGPLRTMLQRFGKGTKIRCVVESEGHAAGKMSTGFEGFMTSWSKANAVQDIQSIQMDVQVTGEVYEMVNLQNFSTNIVGAGAAYTGTAINRATALPAPFNGTGAYSGLVYVMFKNTATTAQVVRIQSSAAMGMTSPTTHLTSPSVAVGDVYVAVAGTANNPQAILQYVQLATTSTLPSNDILNVYVGIVDPTISLLNT